MVRCRFVWRNSGAENPQFLWAGMKLEFASEGPCTPVVDDDERANILLYSPLIEETVSKKWTDK